MQPASRKTQEAREQGALRAARSATTPPARAQACREYTGCKIHQARPTLRAPMDCHGYDRPSTRPAIYWPYKVLGTSLQLPKPQFLVCKVGIVDSLCLLGLWCPGDGIRYRKHSVNGSQHHQHQQEQATRVLDHSEPPFLLAPVLASNSCQSQNPGSEVPFPYYLCSAHFHGDTESHLSDLTHSSFYPSVPSFIQQGCF